MIFVVGSGGGSAAAGSWSFNTAAALPVMVLPMMILAITSTEPGTKYAGKEAPDSPEIGDVWFWIDDPSAGLLLSDGASHFECYGAYQWSGTEWVLLTSYIAWMGVWCELPSLPPIGAALEDCTWAQIDRIGAAGKQTDYFCVGDEKGIVLDTAEAVTLQIIGFEHDDLSGSGGGKAPITFGFKNCLSGKQPMNPTNTNVGGYSASGMYQTINNTIYASLPAELRAVMKNVSKKTSAGNQSATIVTTQERLFLLAEVEIFGTLTGSKAGEGTQYAYFANSGARVKTVDGVASAWWERSPYGGYATHFCYVAAAGTAASGGASGAGGVAPGLCV